MNINPANSLLYIMIRIIKKFDKRQVDLKHLDPDQIKNILVISSTAIGDTLFSGARALIFPTRWPEPLGLVTIEALINRTPVITTPNGAMPEIIKNGVHGSLCTSINEMVEAVYIIEDINPFDCSKRVNNIFHHKIMAQNYVSIYKKMIGVS